MEIIPEATLKKGHGGPGMDLSYPICVALSGGGHRATLFGLGVLMAVRDADKRPVQISSVSGGSVTNAALAHKYYSRRSPTLSDEEDEALWQEATQSLFDTVVEKGIVTKAWMRTIMVFLVTPPLLFVVLALFNALPVWYLTLLAGAVWLTLLLLRGLLIERLISQRCFRTFLPGLTLSDLHNENIAEPVEHVVCCTDLVTGRPFYASTRAGGTLFRRFSDLPAGIGPRTTTPAQEAEKISDRGVTYSADNFSAAAAVRASAGFPGIPPRRVKLRSYERIAGSTKAAQDLSDVAFLSDGGIWNNMATQPYEDGFLWGDYGPWVVLVSDASALLNREKPFGFHIPGVAEFRALARQATIQNINTVGPRRVNYHDWVRRELTSPRSSRFAQERLYPVASCMETPKQVELRLRLALQGEDHAGAFLNDDEQEWREARRDRLRSRADALKQKQARSENQRGDAEVHSDPAEIFRRLCELSFVDGGKGIDSFDPVASFPTTLDRVERSTALAIVGRGYANTAITLYLTGLSDRLPFPNGWLAEDQISA